MRTKVKTSFPKPGSFAHCGTLPRSPSKLPLRDPRRWATTTMAAISATITIIIHLARAFIVAGAWLSSLDCCCPARIQATTDGPRENAELPPALAEHVVWRRARRNPGAIARGGNAHRQGQPG